MAGVKGKSGGPRPNAGRKPSPAPEPAVVSESDPLQFLIDVMQGTIDATPLQVRAAIAAAQYKHVKSGDGGKKEEQAAAAKKAAGGKFKPAAPPLKLVNGR